jgi:hypothetical protein
LKKISMIWGKFEFSSGKKLFLSSLSFILYSGSFIF